MCLVFVGGGRRALRARSWGQSVWLRRLAATGTPWFSPGLAAEEEEGEKMKEEEEEEEGERVGSGCMCGVAWRGESLALS
jgi:hypothetical protein